MTTSANVANIVKADWHFGLPDDGNLVEAKVVSTPNGMSYGINGHIPCNHVAVFTYAKAVKTFHGDHWTRRVL